MWYLISLENLDKKYVLLGERCYVVGRRDCDILLAGDPTVSRKHAELSVSHAEANLTSITKLPLLLLKDLSKFGTWVNKERVQGEKLLKDGDEITFGSDKSLYTVVYEPLVITSSCLESASKKLVRQQLSILGGHMISDWSSDCSLVVMNKISVTIKVICALVSLKHVVLPSYLEDFAKHLQGTSEKPDPTMYTPVIAETQLDRTEVSFVPDNKRKSLFLGMKFVFLSQKQLRKLNQAIELAGGMALLMEESGDDTVLLEKGTIVMNCLESELTPKGVKWAKHVQELLHRHDKHMIQDAEIGYAVLYSSTEKHCNPDNIPDVDLSRIPSQSLSQMEVVVPDTETQHRTQTQGISQRNLTSSARSKQAISARSQARVSSPGPSKRKEAEKQRSPLPTKPSSPTSRQTRHSRSPSPAPQTRVQVKEEPKSQPEILSSTKKRSRPVIEDDSDDDLALPHGGKRVKVEPETPRSNTGRVDKKTNSVPNYASDSEGNEDEDEFDKIDARISSKRNRKTSSKARNPKSASASEDEFDKIDARISSKRNRQTSPKPRNTKHASASDDEFDKIDDKISSKRTRKTSPKPRNSKSASVSMNREDRISPARLNVSRRKSPSPGIETAEHSARVKTEVTEIESTSSRGRSSKGQTRTDVNGLDLGAGDRRSANRGVRKVEVENDDYEMSAVLRVEDSEDTKHNVVSNAPIGFLSTRRPIEDQMPCNRDFEAEPDQPSNCIKIEVVSLVARRPPRRDHANDDCPDGFTRWKGKLVKNFKKFKKAQSGHFGLPTVIGGSDLVVHVPQRSKELDDWFKETVQVEPGKLDIITTRVVMIKRYIGNTRLRVNMPLKIEELKNCLISTLLEGKDDEKRNTDC